MDLSGISWVVVVSLGVVLFSLVVALAAMKNRVSKRTAAESEAATRELYKEEDRAHANEDDGRI